VRSIVSYTYTTELFNDSLNTPQLRRPPTRMIDASLHYGWDSDKYDVAVGGTNLANDRYVTAGSPNYGAGEVGGYYNAPRMWYLSLRAKLGL
jgi:iron complex outermembrane receptor protein